MDDNSDLPPLPPIGEAEDQPSNAAVDESNVEVIEDVREERLGDEPHSVPVNGLDQIGPKEFGRRIGPLFAGLLLMYLLVSANFVGELFSCRLQRIFKENYWAKHLLGIATLFVLVNLFAGAIPWTKGILFGITVVMYLLFVISNRTTAHAQILVIGALAVIYALELVRQDQSNILSRNQDEEIRAEAEEKRDRVLIATYALSGLIMLAIVIGHMVYVGRKKLQFGAEFSYTKLFGGGECLKPNTDNHTDWAGFKAFFHTASTTPPKSPAYSDASFRAHSMTPQAHLTESPRPHFADAVSWFDNGSNMSQYSMQ